MNGDLATTVSLATNAGNRIEVPVPEAVRKGLAERGFLHLEFRFSDAVHPKDSGANIDARNRVLGLLSITVL